MSKHRPPIWLIALLAGFPLLSESIYSPSLPEIAHALQAQESWVEYSLTIYLIGFALGVLFWGQLSDTFGRKKTITAGICVYILGCLGCMSSQSISHLLIARLIQAFGGSVGSVMGQTIARDAYTGPALGRVYAITASSMAIFPAIGPSVGGYLTEMAGWRFIFIALVFWAFILLTYQHHYLPETRPEGPRQKRRLKQVMTLLVRDPKVIGSAFIIGVGNGLNFSYYAEAPFILIHTLGMPAHAYGLTFIGIALSTMSGGLISMFLQKRWSILALFSLGLSGMILSCLISVSATWLFHFGWIKNPSLLIALWVSAQMSMQWGTCIVNSNTLAQALNRYRESLGTASSLFGFAYYLIIAFITLLMGTIHNGSILTMPLFFSFFVLFQIAIIMRVRQRIAREALTAS